uniref:Glycosyltransferase n=1 Tax=Schlesneria paludicola TaxID=360056 RepID=A0A7C2NZE3_9PLAN
MTAEIALSAAPDQLNDSPGATCTPIRVGFVMHVMQVAGAEVLVARIIQELGSRIEPVIFCLDRIGELGERLQSEGVEIVCLHRKPGRDWSVVGRLAGEIQRRRIDVLHAHQYTPFFYSALARVWGGRQARLMLTEHGRHYPDEVSWLRYWANRLVFSRMADRINACCQFSARSLREIDGFCGQPVEVIYNGIDLEAFTPTEDRTRLRARLGLQPDRRYMATVARFHPVKDHATLLSAFAMLASQHGDVDLLLVGDGPLRPDLEAQAAALGIADRVRFWGVRQDVARILQAIDLFVLPSVSEAASLTLLEAMASECPVVVTEVGGNPEIVRQGQDGLLVPRQNPKELADACGRLLDDPEYAKSLGVSARLRVLAMFQQRDTVRRFAELYEALAKRGSSD